MRRCFLSFKNEAILDMRAVPSYKEHMDNLIDTGGKEKYLRVAAVYGANAGGKSNLWSAISCFQNIVMSSSDNIKEEEERPISKYYVPFRLEDTLQDSEFEVVLQINEYEYQYGFSYNDDRIREEWLYRKGKADNKPFLSGKYKGSTHFYNT